MHMKKVDSLLRSLEEMRTKLRLVKMNGGSVEEEKHATRDPQSGQANHEGSNQTIIEEASAEEAIATAIRSRRSRKRSEAQSQASGRKEDSSGEKAGYESQSR